MTEVLNIISIVAGILFSLTGAIATVIGIVPQLRHKALRRAAVALQPHLMLPLRVPPEGIACALGEHEGAVGPTGDAR